MGGGAPGPGSDAGEPGAPLSSLGKVCNLGSPLSVSSCSSAPCSFLPLVSFFRASFSPSPLLVSLSPVFQFLCLFLLSIKTTPHPLRFVFFFFSGFLFFFFQLPFFHPSFSFSVFPISPFLLFSHSPSLPLISPVALSLLAPPSVSFILHFCIICPEQHARERVSVQRQDSPKFPAEHNPYSTSLFVPALLFPS